MPSLSSIIFRPLFPAKSWTIFFRIGIIVVHANDSCESSEEIQSFRCCEPVFEATSERPGHADLMAEGDGPNSFLVGVLQPEQKDAECGVDPVIEDVKLVWKKLGFGCAAGDTPS
jgi:hypothetical protein